MDALASQNRSRAERIAYGYVETHLISYLALAARSIYRLADPSSILSDDHVFVVDYDFNPRLQHDHQQLSFKSAVLWLKEEWIAKEMEWRNPSGDKQVEAVYRGMYGTDHVDPKERPSQNKNDPFPSKIVAFVLLLTVSNRDGTRERSEFPMNLKMPYRRFDDSPRLFQFDNIDILLNNAKIPRGLPAAKGYFGQLFVALYC
jgi:hypothetical protein